MFKKLLLLLIVFFTIGSLSAQDCTEVFIEIDMDNFPQEASWEIFDDSQNLVAQNGEMVAGANYIVLCLVDGCYSMVMYDSFGDGWDLGGAGSVLVTASNNPSGTVETVFDAGDVAFLAFGVNDDGCVMSIPGCMDTTALNYNASATEDDGSCEYACEDGYTPATLYVCTFQNGNEVALDIVDEDGNIVYENSDFSNMEVMYTEICLDPEMCYTVNMYNTVNTGWYGGYYWIDVNGVDVSTGSPADDENFATLDFSSIGPCGDFVLGCMDENACNYDSLANWSDQSCTYPGCMDSTAYNYNMFAGCADESCIYLDPIENDDCADAIEMFCGETVSGATIGATSEELENCGTNISSLGVWYTIQGTDSNINVSTCGQADFDTKISVFTGTCDALDCIGGNDDTSGCTGLTTTLDFYGEEGVTYYVLVHGFGSASGTFDLTASCTGDVVILGCTDATASNFNPIANEDDGSCEYPCEAGLISATLYVCTFSNGNEVAIDIVDEDGNIIYENSDFGNVEIMNTEICLDPEMCYTVNMYNTVNTGWYNGYYWINVNGVQVSTGFLADDENFATVDFSVNGPCGDLVNGCTDSNACNFDSLANWDDQSCTYPGCTDSTAYNYNMFAGCDDGSCIYLDPVDNDDCVDAVAMNCGDTVSGVTIGATIDDLTLCGTGISAPGVWYTIQGTGSNINLSTCGQADFDTKISVFSGSCDSLECIDGNDDTSGCSGFTTTLDFYGENGTTYYVLVHGFGSGVGTFDLTALCSDVAPIYGCMDPLAINFNFEANIDDNSCIYGEPDCLAQFAIYEIDVENNMVVIIDLSTDEDLTYLWDFGDGTTSTDMLPVHYYEQDGTYEVCLTITNTELECSDTFCMAVTYIGEGYIIDGQNVVFAAEDGFSINIINHATISVDENTFNESSMLIYPNPTSDQLTLEINEFQNGNAFYQVIDITGKVVLSDQIVGLTSTISVNSLSNGIYMLKLENNNQISVQRFEISK